MLKYRYDDNGNVRTVQSAKNDGVYVDYLNALVRHAKEAADHPTRWFPWNYRQALPVSDPG